MNIESLRYHLATVVRGWTQGETEFQWNDKDGNRMLDGILFDPLNNVEQAIGCLESEKIAWWQRTKSGEVLASPKLGMLTSSIGRSSAKPFSKAASIAVARATGWKE